MTLIDVGDGSQHGITTSVDVQISPEDLGWSIATMTSREQAMILVGFAQGMQSLGVLEWRMQAAYIAGEFKDQALRHQVDEVLGEIAAGMHTMDDRAEDER